MMVAHSFFAKWAFKGDRTRDGLESLIQGTASRPFVYRRLAPDLVGAATQVAVEHLPPTAIEFMEKSPLKRYRIDWGGVESWTPRKAVEFQIAYALVWCALFCALLAGAVLVRSVRECSAMEAIVTSTLAIALVPLIFVGGGYIYDAPELFLWTTLLVLAIRGWLVLMPLVFFLMVVNKESALIAIPVLFPILFARAGKGPALKWTAILGAVGVIWVAYVRRKFATNGGQPMESWFIPNLEFWSQPTSYLKMSQLFSPGLLSPQGANILLLFLVFLPFRFGWKDVPYDIRWAAVVAAAILVPLFLTSCRMDEIRNLSLLFPFIFIVDVFGINAMFKPKVAAPSRSGKGGGLPEPATRATAL